VLDSTTDATSLHSPLQAFSGCSSPIAISRDVTLRPAVAALVRNRAFRRKAHNVGRPRPPVALLGPGAPIHEHVYVELAQAKRCPTRHSSNKCPNPENIDPHPDSVSPSTEVLCRPHTSTRRAAPAARSPCMRIAHATATALTEAIPAPAPAAEAIREPGQPRSFSHARTSL